MLIALILFTSTFSIADERGHPHYRGNNPGHEHHEPFWSCEVKQEGRTTSGGRCSSGPMSELLECTIVTWTECKDLYSDRREIRYYNESQRGCVSSAQECRPQ